jgi:hypothetical protein
MADTHEEQLLTELLSEMKAADVHLDAADLEARVMSALEERTRVMVRPYSTYVGVAAALLMVALAPLSNRIHLEPLPAVQSPVLGLASIDAPLRVPEPLPNAESPNAHSQVTQSPDAPIPITQSSIAFVPLMPMSERELAGPFQILRVQMPRASLGALTSPFDHPNEIVEADVLLGEDGMARAIRVSTNDSMYPWRSR